jgi:hypothetical protein
VRVYDVWRIGGNIETPRIGALAVVKIYKSFNVRSVSFDIVYYYNPLIMGMPNLCPYSSKK